MNHEHHANWEDRIKSSFAILEKKPEDRLALLMTILQIKDVAVATFTLLEPLADVELSHMYEIEDLEKIREFLVASTTPLRDMLWHFYQKSVEEHEKNTFAI